MIEGHRIVAFIHHRWDMDKHDRPVMVRIAGKLVPAKEIRIQTNPRNKEKVYVIEVEE